MKEEVKKEKEIEINKNSLRNEVDLEIPYVNEEGKKGIKKVHITFISAKIYKAYSDIQNELLEIVKLNEDLNNNAQNIGYNVASEMKLKGLKGIKGAIDDIKDTRKKSEEIAARMQEIVEHMFDHKFDLIQKILLKNGIGDEDMKSIDWWLDCVDMNDMNNFITCACTKDDEKLKKKL